MLRVSSWSPSLLRGFLWVKALYSCWTSDGAAFGVVTILKVSLLEILLSQAMEGLPMVWQGSLVQVASSKGVA